MVGSVARVEYLIEDFVERRATLSRALQYGVGMLTAGCLRINDILEWVDSSTLLALERAKIIPLPNTMCNVLCHPLGC